MPSPVTESLSIKRAILLVRISIIAEPTRS
jgi:hypothetical protein